MITHCMDSNSKINIGIFSHLCCWLSIIVEMGATEMHATILFLSSPQLLPGQTRHAMKTKEVLLFQRSLDCATNLG